MRNLFSRQLIETRHEMLSIFEAVDLALHDAVKALVEGDRDLAKKTISETLRIDARCANLEAITYNLIATQSPMASDLRLLQSIIFVNFNLERMSNHVRGIARGAKRAAKEQKIPENLLGLVDEQAKLVYVVLGETVNAWVNNDLNLVSQLIELDEPVDSAYKRFFREYNAVLQTESETSFDNMRRAIMASRYLERISDISVEIGGRLIFMLTGQRINVTDLLDANESALESMRVPSGEDVFLDPESDVQFVANLDTSEVGSHLASQIESIREAE